MTIRKLAMPWAAPGDRTYCLPTSFLVTLQLGEATDSVPALVDVRGGYARAATGLDGGALDRMTTGYGAGESGIRYARVRQNVRDLFVRKV